MIPQNNELLKLANDALSESRKLGSDETKISVGSSESQRLVVENKEFTLANSLTSRSIGITVHKDQKKGTATTNIITPKSVKEGITHALSLAQYSIPDDALNLALLKDAPKAKPLKFMFEESLAEVTLPELYEIMAQVLKVLTSDPRIALDRFELSVDKSFHGLLNSHGVEQHEVQTMATWSFFGMARSGEQVTGFDYDGGFSYKKEDILSKCIVDAHRFVKKLIAALNPVQAPSYKGLIILSPRATEEILLSTLLYHVGGRQVMDGKSRWEKSVGSRVVNQAFTLTDSPHSPEYSGATSFDGDGLPTAARTIFDRGILQCHLHDIYSAKKTGSKSTATSGGPFALQISSGRHSMDEIYKSHGKLVLVDRFSGNVDPIKGDFSGVAKSSRLIVNGEDQGPVTETMIAGNAFDLANQIVMVSQNLESVGGSFMSPYVVADGVSVSGS